MVLGVATLLLLSFPVGTAFDSSFRLGHGAGGISALASGGGAGPTNGTLPPGPNTITFTETGLPTIGSTGTYWNVTLDDTMAGSTNSTVSFTDIAAGNYTFQIGYMGDFVSSPSSGWANVTGQNVTWNTTITFPRVYTVTFHETGLPLSNSASWSVTLDGSVSSSLNSTVSFREPNGSYFFTVDGFPGYVPSPSTGWINVQGGPVGQNISWQTKNYTVTFSETGLPSGTGWTIFFDDSNSTTTHSSLPSFSVPNGSYSYTASTQSPYYRATPPSGTVTVQGAPVSLSIQFVHLWTVSFTETGLPSGRAWNVTLDQTTHSSTSPTISFNTTNGTHPFTVGFESGYAPTPPNGTVTVNGSGSTTSISFVRVYHNYTVTFSESGLPKSTNWTVVLSSYGSSTVQSPYQILFSVPNGTFAYSVENVSGFSPLPLTGSVTVSGSSKTVFVTFLPTYNVTFHETGLPLSGGPSWSVRLGGNTASGSVSSLVIPELPGNYTYSVGAILGYLASPTRGNITVAQQPITVNILWTVVNYSVTFAETGLPSNVTWSWEVTLGRYPNALSRASSTPMINFSEPNGTYPFAVGNVPGFVPVPSAGNVTVPGGNVTQTIVFQPEATYNVFFNESGLVPGTRWNVTVDSVEYDSVGPTILFVAVNGTYPFQVGAVTGYTHTVSPSGSSVVVKGANRTILIVFTAIPYSVSFTESGLPGGTNWSVALGGLTKSATTNTIRFSVPNGCYLFSIPGQDGYVAAPSSGTLLVNGTPVVETVVWSKFTYLLAFSETGLPTSTNWSVSLAGITKSTNSSEIDFSVANGSYYYSLGVVPGYRTTARTGQAAINANDSSVALSIFAVTYSVTFREYGLPSGTNWTITIAGANFSTPSTSLVLSLQNGSYPFTVTSQTVGGTSWVPTASTGVVNVTGRANSTVLHFVRGPAGPLFTFTVFDEELLVVTLVIVLVLALLGFVVRPLNRRHRTGPNPLIPPADEAAAPRQPPSGAGSASTTDRLLVPGTELAPTPENSAALLRLAVAIGRVIAQQKGPKVETWTLELRRAMDLIETYRLTEAMRVLGRLRMDVTSNAPSVPSAASKVAPSKPASPSRTPAKPRRARWANPTVIAPSGAARSGASVAPETSEPVPPGTDAPISGVGASLEAWRGHPERGPPRRG